MGSFNTFGLGQVGVSPLRSAGSSFLSLAGAPAAAPLKQVNATKTTVAAYASELGATAKPTAHKAFDDAYVASDSVSGQLASALSQKLVVEDAKGNRTSASLYLANDELRLLGQLPEHYRRQVLSVDTSQPVEAVREKMQNKLKTVIGKMAQSGHVKFKDNGAQWELGALLSLANAVERLPLAQRKQLDGVTFQRSAKPASPAVVKPELLDQIAMDTIAGRYDIVSKTVTLFDRGVQDTLPELGPGLRQSLRVIQQRGSSEDIRQLQKMLNPYMALLNQPALGEDGKWGAGTARAIRMVQMELLSRNLEKLPLSAEQRAELKSLTVLGASSQFDLITRMTDVQSKMKNLNLLPDPHLKQLLQEFTRSEFGEASLQFLMQDISNDFRSTPKVSRVEEILTHEMGHHFQLGQSNESHYISEFGKLSNWRETGNGEQADGYVGGAYTSEDIRDVYHVLACDCKQDKGYYKPDLSPAEHSQRFVSNYAATDPMEDFAESYKDFVLEPVRLLRASPEKFFFINSLPAIQARKTGAGVRETSHYQPQQIEGFVQQLLTERYNKSVHPDTVKTYIREQFQSLMDAGKSRKLGLNPDVVLAIVETHKPLLERANMPYISPDLMLRQSSSGSADEEVFRKLHDQTRKLLVSQGHDKEAQNFFARFNQPGEIDRLFPKASPQLREKLKDPAFSSMMLALGKIGGYAFYINQLQNKDLQDQQSYQQAQDYFGRVLDQPSSLFSNKTFSYSWNYLRGLGAEVFNPEASKVSTALQFFQQLEKNPKSAFPDLWQQFPADFQELLSNRRFIQAVSGDHGRYLPSSDATRKVIEEVMEMLEFQRNLPDLGI